MTGPSPNRVRPLLRLRGYAGNRLHHDAAIAIFIFLRFDSSIDSVEEHGKAFSDVRLVRRILK